MRSLQCFLILIIVMAFAGTVFAVSSGKAVEYAGGSQGKVTFDGKTHADKGLKCTDCNTKIFPMKKGTKITMAEMNAGKYCGVCHNSEKTFKSSGQALTVYTTLWYSQSNWARQWNPFEEPPTNGLVSTFSIPSIQGQKGG